ncbi:MAG: glucose-6-phosphate dehydrogenase [Deltaproteobacteria bacterium]|nr:glucose-6-phosphate dehydrogenase [Deltaproteobacteria bacterium]
MCHVDPTYQKIGGCEIEIPNPCCLIIFGASGDLTKRKLVPALYRLHKNNLLPEKFFVLGVGRMEMHIDSFREDMLTAVKEIFPEDFNHAYGEELAAKLYYFPLDYSSSESYIKFLANQLSLLEAKHNTGRNRIFYLAIPPTVFEDVIVNLGNADLSREDGGRTHIVVEKPFGRDLKSAKRLNRILKKSFQEHQIYRIDHYLAKETVQDIMMFRFANSIFEPLWNNKYIDHVQITVAENIGIEQRAGYYEESGVIRDMFPNHIFQLLALTAMEPPVKFDAGPVRDEKVKVFRSMRPFPLDGLGEYIVTGQYGAGKTNGNAVVGYREESGVSRQSTTPTFAAMKIFVDNWRWKGVPFYLRSGKRLSNKKTEISIQFKPVPHMMFSNLLNEPIEPNTLVLRVQPDEGINLLFQAKEPGSKVCLRPVIMDFSYQGEILLDAYEWVLLDCMHGDTMLSVREDAVEQTWAFLTPVIERLESTAQIGKFPNYAAGSSGPTEAALLIEKDGRGWRPL